MFRKIMRTVLILVLMTTMTACASSAEDTAASDSGSTDKDRIQIGMTFDSFIIERWERDRDIFVSTAKDLGADVNVQNANGDIEEQKKQIEYLIKKKMDVIVIIAVDSSSLRMK